MPAERILDEIGTRQGWNDESKLTLCLRYIENQGDDSAFEDFLQRQADEENASWEGTEGQDRESYSDEQDRESYEVDPKLED